MILKVTKIGPLPDGTPRVIAQTQDKSFKYEGGINQDMVDTMAGREKAYFEASIGPGGLEIGDEVKGLSW